MIFWLKSENKKLEKVAARKGVEPFRYMIYAILFFTYFFYLSYYIVRARARLDFIY